ncbi:hypothetical protein GCM10009836_58190 [Pseudonocardia ailaonensis]|uniref:Uncharacterized protein n=1 Tax=Pseudonocardia ailaonensis TaxID=367279 RepID=A0ABN2NHV1_9PSEU
MFRSPERWPAVLAAALGLTAVGGLAGAAFVVDAHASAAPALAAEFRVPPSSLALAPHPPTTSPRSATPTSPETPRRPAPRIATTPPAPAPAAATTARAARPTPVAPCATVAATSTAPAALPAPVQAALAAPTSADVEQGCPESREGSASGAP